MAQQVNSTASNGRQLESVQDFPEAPTVEQNQRHLRVVLRGTIVAETNAGFRMTEKGLPPSYYFPPDAVNMKYLNPAAGQSFCRWKGHA